MTAADGGPRAAVKNVLARMPDGGGAAGASLLIYHRVGGGSPDERDLAVSDFHAQLDVLASHRVVSLDDAVTALRSGDASHRVVLTFDDGFADVYEHAWPALRERELPFTLYLASGYVGGRMHWDGSTARADGDALTWDQLGEMVRSGLCTIGNHTHTHARPEALTPAELDRCSEEISEHLGVRPRHFAYTWGIPVPAMAGALAERFDTAATGELGRNLPGCDLMALRRIPVRQSDPIDFFAAKLRGRGLRAERAYAGVVRAAKRLGASA
jgi:peptidoglycan/xylan/chitin deacetylase (PgdA/CDA1 family)